MSYNLLVSATWLLRIACQSADSQRLVAKDETFSRLCL